MWNDYISATGIDEVLQILAKRSGRARIVAGATDLLLELERGVRQDIETLVDVTRIPGLNQIALDNDGIFHLGPVVTHNQCATSEAVQKLAYPLARACWEVGSPQIRNRGTIAGNIITASPANDTITPLMALDAWVVLRSLDGMRQVSLREFYQGVRRTVIRPDEMVVDIAFPAMEENQRGTFVKFALRQAQAISLVNVAIILTLDDQQVTEAKITLGAVAPTIIHAIEAEKYLIGRKLTEATIWTAAEMASQDARPISDIRATAVYRTRMTNVVTRRALTALSQGRERFGMPHRPVLLAGRNESNPFGLEESLHHDGGQPIMTRINGTAYTLAGGQQKTLLRLLREDAGLIGTKEGCAEGECGACTVILDGMAVMSCMVPAPRAHGADIITIEGLVQDGNLHPVQAAFMEKGAVQCGYCTPGFLMSATKLLEECPRPNATEIREAFTGNLCRCTGYYQIIEAVELAATRLQVVEETGSVIGPG